NNSHCISPARTAFVCSHSSSESATASCPFRLLSHGKRFSEHFAALSCKDPSQSGKYYMRLSASCFWRIYWRIRRLKEHPTGTSPHCGHCVCAPVQPGCPHPDAVRV